MKKHAERKHAKFAPSASHRWLKCRGSIKLCEKAPPERFNPAAAEGTTAHECLEFVSRKSPIVGLKAVKKLALERWPEAMVFHALRSWDTICELQPPSTSSQLLIESRVRLSPEVYGSLDHAWVEPWGELIVMDYKYGMHVVLPKDQETGEENSQLLCYATALAKTHDWEFETVKLAIIQPRAWDETETPLTIAETRIKRLREFEREVKDAVAEALSPNAKLVYGEEHCRWCPAKSFCPAFEAGQSDPSQLAFDIETPKHKT